MSKPITAEILRKAKRLARDLKRDAWQDEIFPLSDKMEGILAAELNFWKGDPNDLKDAEVAAKKWLGVDGMIQTAAEGSTIGGSALIAAKASLIERLLCEQSLFLESGAMTLSSEAETPEELFLLLWEKIAPASEGWSNEYLRDSLRTMTGEQ